MVLLNKSSVNVLLCILETQASPLSSSLRAAFPLAAMFIGCDPCLPGQGWQDEVWTPEWVWAKQVLCPERLKWRFRDAIHFQLVARIKDIGALDLCCLVSATKHWSFEMWLVQIEIFCKCKLHIRFQRLDMKKKWDYLIKNFYIDHMLNCILNILMKAIFKK